MLSSMLPQSTEQISVQLHAHHMECRMSMLEAYTQPRENSSCIFHLSLESCTLMKQSKTHNINSSSN